jgi:hypothetical protein
MADVGKLAGVSHQTVSRVLNYHPNGRRTTVRQDFGELGGRAAQAAGPDQRQR